MSNRGVRASPTWDHSLRRIARRHLSPTASRWGKRVAVHGRYLQQIRASRRGFREHGRSYPHPILFIAGLPKSGTTWLKRMIASYPGYHEVMIPEVASHELAAGGSHDYELPDGVFARVHDALVVMKLHAHGSRHNAAMLDAAGVPYIVLYRDLRDVAVSYCFYVRNTPWHPEYEKYTTISPQDGLRLFADDTLRDYMAWIELWKANRNPSHSLMVRYEDLVDDTHGRFRDIAAHLGLDSDDVTIGRIVADNSFEALSGGRQRGEENTDSFFRKGVRGDWRNHFSDGLAGHYSAILGDFLLDLGYEE